MKMVFRAAGMKRIVLACLRGAMLAAGLVAFAASLGRAEAHQQPVEREMQLVYVFDDGAQKPEFLFVIGQSGFRSVDALERYLATLPRGSELRWAPGCTRTGGEPLLSSDEDMKAFEAFLDAHGIKFVLVPSG
jgi:hypothetical protein